MKNYNKSFSIEITANMIAAKLRESINTKLSDTKIDNLVDTIIGPMVSNDNNHALQHLYYGLFDVDVEAPAFKKDQKLYCTQTHRDYIEEVEGEPRQSRSVEIGECKLIGFDTYRKHGKYEIEYLCHNSAGESHKEACWTGESSLSEHPPKAAV